MDKGGGEEIRQPEWWHILGWRRTPTISSKYFSILADLIASLRELEERWVDVNKHFYNDSRFRTYKEITVWKVELLDLWVNPWLVVDHWEWIIYKDAIWAITMVNLALKGKIYLEIHKSSELIEYINEFLSRSPSRIILQNSWNWHYTLLFQNRIPRWN